MSHAFRFSKLLLVQVSRDASSAVAGTDGATRFRRWEWGRQIKEGQAAHAWSRFLTPLYGMQVIGLLASATYAVRLFLLLLPF